MTDKKSDGASRDFAGTWMCYIEFPIVNEVIQKWAARIDADDIENDKRVCKGGIVREQGINILLGLPCAPTDDLVKILQRVPAFNLKLGMTQCFEEETVTVENIVHKYRVLNVQILESENKELTDLQKLIGTLYGGVLNPIVWHHPKYQAHLTIGFIKSGTEGKFVGQNVLSNMDTVQVSEIKIKKFQDKSFKPVTIKLM